MPADPNPSHERLGALVRARREELGLSQDDVKTLGGPSPATQRKIESGVKAEYRLGTTWPLERVFGWRPGAINGYLRYGNAPDVAVEVDYSAFRATGSPMGQTSSLGGAAATERPTTDLAEIPLEELLAEISRRAGVIQPPSDD